MSRPSRFICLSGLIAACLLRVAPADAVVFLVRPDGSGDVPTIQAGLDSLMVNPGDCGFDTLLVAAGTYDEDVSLIVRPGRDVRGVVLASEGRDRTFIRSFSFGADSGPLVFGDRKLNVEGLTISGEVRQGSSQAWFRWERCRFAGGFTSTLRIPSFSRIPFEACEFRRFAVLQGYGPQYMLQNCRFVGAPARLDGTEYGLRVRDCVFEGPADTAVVANTGGDGGMWFERCTFTGVGHAIVLRPEAPVYSFRLAHCGFVDVAGVAVSYRRAQPFQHHERSEFYVDSSRFERCRSAMRLEAPSSMKVVLRADTISACTGAGVEADVDHLDVSGVEVSGCGGAGARFRWLGPVCPGATGGATATVSNSRFTDNRGAGLEISSQGLEECTDSPVVSGCVMEGNGGDGFLAWTPVTGTRSTSLLNGGAGFRLNSRDGSQAVPLIEANIAAGNAGYGFVVEGGIAATVLHNDSWMNAGGDFQGVSDHSSSLTLDPQFCDVVAGDYRVAASSPCATSGPYGQIGALGVGCDVMTVPLDVRSHPINPRSNAPVEAAILGHRLFDPRRVDVATVRLAEAAPALRGRSARQLRDANGDGITDLVLTFDARDLRLDGGEVELEGMTIDGAPFRGSDAVEVKELPSRAAPGIVAAPNRLSLAVLPPRRDPSLLINLPTEEPATLEAFDIAGRRVWSRDLRGLGPGRHRVRMAAGLASGLYLVRLEQGSVAVVARVVARNAARWR